VIDWLKSIGPDNGAVLAFFVVCGALLALVVLGVVLFGALQSVATARSRARIAEADARTAEAKTRRAELLSVLQPPTLAQQGGYVAPDEPAPVSMSKAPAGGLADVPD
jgi:hypothetical protein